MSNILTSQNGQALNPEDLEGAFPVRPGIILVAPHGEMVARREKTLFVKSRPYRKYVGVPVYVLQDSQVLALIDHSEPREISLVEFASLRERHRISEEERKRWWPKAKALYAYEFKLLEAYDPPLKARKLPRGPQVFVQRVAIEPREALEEGKAAESSDLLYDLSPPNYPTEAFVDLRELAENFPEMLVLASKFLSLRPLPEEGQLSLRCDARWENGTLVKDLSLNSPEIDLIWDLFRPLGRDSHWVPSRFGPNWTYFPIFDLGLVLRPDAELSPELQERIPPSMIWIPEFVSASGSSVYARDRTPRDIDIVLRAEDGQDFKLILDRSLNLKLSRVLDTTLRWNSPEFSHLDHTPTWDLCLLKRKPLEVRIIQEPDFAALYYKAAPSKRAEAKLRAGSPEIRGQAEQSLQQDSVEPKRALYSLKPFRGAVAGEHMTLDSFFGLLKTEDFPMFSSTKRDGVTCIWARDGDWVRVLSDDGENLTERLGPLIEEFKRISPNRLVLCTEVEAWRGTQHFPREKAAGILHSGQGIDQLLVQIFDCVYHGEEGDIHKRPFEERYALFSKLNLRSAPRFRFIRHRKASSLTSLKRIAIQDIKANGSEGCVVKRADAPYPLTGEPGKTRCSFKYHKNATIRGTVLGAMRTKGGAWVHRYGLLPGKLKPIKVESVGGQDYSVVGRTFARATRYAVGSTIKVECETLNETRRADGTVSVTLWVPNLISKVEEKPMTLEEAISEGERCGVLQVKVVDAAGNVEYLPTKPAKMIKGLEWHESFDPFETYDLVKAVELFLKAQRPPPEKGTYRYVVQSHFRGKSNHKDLRAEFNKYLWGRTLLDQIAGQTKEPVVTLAQAKREDARDIWKIDWRNGQIKKRRIRGGQIRRAQIRVEAKAAEIPRDWFDVEGVTERTEPGERPPAGATRKYPGVFHIIDRGVIEYGAFKPWFQELFLSQGKLREGRWVFRMIEREATKDSDTWPDEDLLIVWDDYSEEEKEAYSFVGEALLERGLIFKAEVLPAGKIEERPRGPSYWTLIQPEEEERWSPYVLSKRAIDAEWVPPRGYSALPKSIRSKVPKHLRFWNMERKAALEARRELSQIEELGGPGKLRKEAEVEKLHLEQFRSEGIDEDLKHPRTRWRELLADARYLGNSAWPRLKRGESWGDWTKEDVLRYFAKIVDVLRSVYFPLLERKDESSYWDCYHAAKKYMKSEPPDPEEVPDWDDKREKLLKEAEEEALELKAEPKPFTLQFHSWRGPIVIRYGRSDWHWDLRIQENGTLWHLILNEKGDDPLESEESVGVEKPCRAEAQVETGTWEGKHFEPGATIGIMDIKLGQEVGLKPGTEANPTIETPAWIETSDRGTAILLGQGPDWRKYRFKGERLKGAYIFYREKGAKNWYMSKSEGPKVKAIIEGAEWPGVNASAVRKTPLRPEKFDKCMIRSCDQSAEIEVLWAEGRALARFCRSCYLSWYDEMQEEGEPDPTEIVRAYIRPSSATKEDVEEETSGAETSSSGSTELAEVGSAEVTLEDSAETGKDALVKEGQPDYNSGKPRFYSRKQADGQWRWIMVSSTAVLDKIGEIVSRKAIDKGIERADRSADKGELLFWHIPWLRFGTCDFQAREGLCLIESGLWDDTPFAQKARETTSLHPQDWGGSIGFKGLQVQENVQVLGQKVRRVYDDIIFQERSILPEWAACAHFTFIATAGDEEMKATQEQALRQLIGDEDTDSILEKARDIEDKVLATGLVFKETDEDPPQNIEKGSDPQEKAAKKPYKEPEEEEEGKKKQECEEEEEEEEQQKARFATQLRALIEKIEDASLRRQFEALASKLEETYGKYPKKTLGGLIGAIETKLTALRKKVSGEVAEAVDEIINLAKNLRGYGQAYPSPQKGEAEAELVELRGQMGAVAEAVLSLAQLVKDIQLKASEEEKAAKPKKPEEEEEEEEGKKKAEQEQEEKKTEEKDVKDLLDQVRQEMSDLKSQFEAATKPVRKSTLPSEEEQEKEVTKETELDLSSYSDDQIRDILRFGLRGLSKKS